MSNNTSIDVLTDYMDDYKSFPKNAFSEFFNEKLDTYNEYHEPLDRNKVADILGISHEMFKKIVNKNKPTKKRDCIIAICIVLNLSIGELYEAIDRYGEGMQILNENDPRDEFIQSQILHNENITIKELNAGLIQHKFPVLDIHSSKDSKNIKSINKKFELSNLPYEILEAKTFTPVNIRIGYANPYDSLSTQYEPSLLYSCNGYMYLKDKEHIQYIRLELNSSGSIWSEIINGDSKSYNSIEEAGIFKDYFIALNSNINREKRRLYNILNDTRNYQKRISANLINDSICIYTEQFNYRIPEFNEYYILTLSSGNYKLYVYKESAFMAWYLSDAGYKEYYGRPKPEPTEIYDSLESLENSLIQNKSDYEKYDLYHMRISAFKKMIPDVDSLHEKLINEEVFILNRKNIFDNEYQVLEAYNLASEYECKYDEYGEIDDCLESKEFTLSDSTTITITLDDLNKAYELGFPDIHTICRIKAKLGSIKDVLK